jgi:CIC family chloride channel protein
VEIGNRIFGKLPKQPRTVLLTVIYALVAGGSAVVFQLLINVIYNSTFVRLSHLNLREFLVGSFIVITASSLIVGWLLSSFCRKAAGSGIPQLKLAFWKDFGFVSWRTIWVKFVAGALSLGGGNSLGREGPSVHIGGGIGSNFAGLFGEPKQNRRRAAAAGAAAGLAAAFNTPLASITFVLEEIIEDLNSRFLGSVLLASVIGAMVVHAIVGQQPAFRLGETSNPGWMAYVLVPLVSAVASLVGVVFQKSTMQLRPRKLWGWLPRWARPLLGGWITWVLGAAVFAGTGHLGVFSLGYDDLSAGLANQIGWKIAALLLITKLIATIACYAFGGCGGIFSPTLFLGGMTGVALSGLFNLAFPLAPGDQMALAVVGMSACLGAVVGAPVTGILIVFEMTHEFSLVPVLMIGALVSQSIRRMTLPHNFYEQILLQDGHNLDQVIPPRDLRDWQQLPVSAIANFHPVIFEGAPGINLETFWKSHPYSRFPAMREGKLGGIVTRKELQAAAREGREPQMEAICKARARQTIREVQPLLLASEHSMVCIVDETERVIALLTLHDLLRAQLAFVDKKE